MPLVKVQTRPGIVREKTQFANSGGWYDSDKVRFRSGFPESIGGWKPLTTFIAKGVTRSLHEWASLDGNGHLGVGTNSKFYVLSNDLFSDVTPLQPSVTLNSNPFSTIIGSSNLQVVFPAPHGASIGDYIQFSGATTSVGSYASSVLNAEFLIVDVIDLSNLIIEITPGTIASSVVSGGGSNIHAILFYPSGSVDATYARGYGVGPYGAGGYGQPSSSGFSLLSVIVRQPRTWSQDNFGEDLIINPRGGPIYIWDASSAVGVPTYRATLLSAAGGAADVPSLANEIFVSTVDQNVVALGCTPFGSSVLDPMYVRWSDQLNPYLWTPTNTTAAGGYRLSSGSLIVGHLSTANETLIWTDQTLYSMQYRGGSVIYGFAVIGDGLTLMSPRSSATNGSVVFWMGNGAFFVYSGMVQELPCDVKDYVFKGMNRLQAWKIYAMHNRDFSEIWWFYPSLNSNEVDSYVAFNYKDNNWVIGKLDRTAWIYSSRLKIPIAAAPGGQLYLHEFGVDADTVPMKSFIESADFDSSSGNEYMLATRVIPDVQFTGPGNYQTFNVEILSRDTSGAPKNIMADIVVSKESRERGVRVRGRRLSVRVGSNTLGTGWRLGQTEVDLIESGSR